MGLFRIKKQQQKTVTQYTTVKPLIVGYQLSSDVISAEVYWDQNATNPVIAVAGGTITRLTTTPPQKADKFRQNIVLGNLETGRPLVPFQTAYTRIVGTTTAMGAKVAVRWNLTSALAAFGYLPIVVRSPVASQTFTVTLRSTGGNEDLYTFTSSATTNTWSKPIRILGQAVAGGEVTTRTGTPAYGAITEVEVLVNGTLDVAYLDPTENEFGYVGATISKAIPCLASSGQMTDNLKTAEIMCNLLVEGVTPTGRSHTFEFETNDKDLMMISMAMGDSIRASNFDVPRVFSSEGIGARFAIASNGTVNIGIGLNVVHIVCDGSDLSSNASPTVAASNGNNFCYNSSTGLLTVSTEYAGLIPEIFITYNQSLQAQQMRNVKTGFVGYVVITRSTDNNEELFFFPSVQLSFGGETSGESNDTMKIMGNVLARNGSFGSRSHR